MLQLILKALLTAVIVVAASELSRRSERLSAVLISLPLTTILYLCWEYAGRPRTAETTEFLARQTTSVLWLVVASVPFFLLLPPMLRRGVPFVAGMLVACTLTAATYALMLVVLPRLGVRL